MDVFDYWDSVADEYQGVTRISIDDFHYGPLVPGDGELRLLPDSLENLQCLEIGCGAAQNSVFLAKRGAICSALDASEAQLSHAERLGKSEGVELTLVHADARDVADHFDAGKFDLVHSSYALAFFDDPEAVIVRAARLLKPGGTLIFSTGHPLAAGEWIELDEDETGQLISDYFNPPADVRRDENGNSWVTARFHPVSTIFEWIVAAGLTVERFLEPSAMDLPPYATYEQAVERMPYVSPAWLELHHQYRRVPVVAIFACVKDSG